MAVHLTRTRATGGMAPLGPFLVDDGVGLLGVEMDQRPARLQDDLEIPRRVRFGARNRRDVGDAREQCEHAIAATTGHHGGSCGHYKRSLRIFNGPFPAPRGNQGMHP